jgi:hypothetical protein
VGGHGGAFGSWDENDFLWERLHVDGQRAAAVSWAQLPRGRWAHVHLLASRAFTDDVTLMARRPGYTTAMQHVANRDVRV